MVAGKMIQTGVRESNEAVFKHAVQLFANKDWKFSLVL